MLLHIFSLDVDDLPTKCLDVKFPKKPYARREKLTTDQKIARIQERKETKIVANAARFMNSYFRASR